jgi:hypothetical protein
MAFGILSAPVLVSDYIAIKNGDNKEQKKWLQRHFHIVNVLMTGMPGVSLTVE